MTVSTGPDIVKQLESLPPLPRIAHRIQSITSAPNTSAEHVARVLGGDPAIASRILRVANSSFYGASGKVAQVSRAVVILGARAINNLVLGLCARNSLIPSTGQVSEHVALWTHSIAVAASCDQIARKVGFNPPEEAFLAGLLHDIGKLAMVTFDTEFVRGLLHERPPERRCLEMERAHFGMDHAETGSEILSRWGLPESFGHVAGQHHAPRIDINGDSDRLVAMVMIANCLVQIAGFGPDMPVGDYQRAAAAAQRLGLSRADQARLLAGLDHRVEDAIEAMSGTGTGKPISPAWGDLQRVVWVSSENEDAPDISRSLLECKGCAVRRVSPSDYATDLSPDDLVMIDLASEENDTADRIALTLAELGHHKTVLLGDLPDGVPFRRHDPDTGVCCIPSVFTAFDLKWLEEQWQQ